MIEHIEAQTFHARRGGLRNAFSYGVDFILREPDTTSSLGILSTNRFNLWHLSDRNHGGHRGEGRGVQWFRELLESRGFPVAEAQLLLLTQPSFLWFHFNPVSFWIALLDGVPHAFVAEVNSTFGQRHCYFCAHESFGPISPNDSLVATKLMHVSPFQSVTGRYVFNFGMTAEEIDIRINYEAHGQGVLATLRGARRQATNASLLRAAIRRPFGSARVLTLIHWQALLLFLKRAPFLRRQAPPDQLISNGRPIDESKV